MLVSGNNTIIVICGNSGESRPGRDRTAVRISKDKPILVRK